MHQRRDADSCVRYICTIAMYNLSLNCIMGFLAYDIQRNSHKEDLRHLLTRLKQSHFHYRRRIVSHVDAFEAVMSLSYQATALR